jgi:diguanylate cyclase (GGDEF)-like protein
VEPRGAAVEDDQNQPTDQSDVQALLDASRLMAGCGDLADLLKVATRLLRILTPATVASLGRVDQDTYRALTIDPPIRDDGWSGGTPATEYRASKRPALRSLIRDRRSWVVDAFRRGGDPVEIETLLAQGMAAAVAIPVLVHGAVWGQLYLARREPSPFTPSEVALLEVFAALFAGALLRVDIAGQVEQLVAADPLTGLPNRRTADRAIEAALASGGTTCVVMCDVDGLKRINDERGHERGDELLRSVADVMRRMREALPGSTAVRLGGDEFCVITVSTPPEDVLEVVERELALGDLPYGASVSYGISSTENAEPTMTARSLFRLADAAQYRAKRARKADGNRAPGAPGVVVQQFKVLDDGLASLDTLTRDAQARGDTTNVADRLSIVAAALTEAVGAVRWYVSVCTRGSSSIVEVARGCSTVAATLPALTDPLGKELAVAAHPASARALDGGVFAVHVADQNGDPREVALLAATDASAAIGAGGADATGCRWLVELYFDSLDIDLSQLAGPVRAVVAAAIVGPA